MSAVIQRDTRFPLALFAWFLYISAYLIFINVENKIAAGWLALIGQVGLDVVFSIASFWHLKTTQDRRLKFTYSVFGLSGIAAACADLIYHTSMNIINESYFNEINSLFEIPFILFLFFQAIAWCSIFFIGHKTSNSKKYSYVPYAMVSLFILFTFVSIIPWKIDYLSRLGIYQLIDTVLEVIGLSLAALCLTRAKENSLRFLSIGFLLIISSDLLIRYDVISGFIPSFNVFETSWSLGLLLMVSALVFARRDSSITLLPLNSLQAYISIWLLNLLLMFVGIFLCLNHYFPDKDISHYLLWIIVPCTFFAILGSKYFASKILSPLARLESIIKDFLNAKNPGYSNIVQPPIQIEDFNLLEKFVYDAFDLYKRNHHIEIEYAKMATQVAHDIQSPMLALNNYFKEAVPLDKNKFEVVEASLYRVNEIANNLLIQYKKAEMNPANANNEVELISAFLQPLVEEKKLQFKGGSVEIDLCIDRSAEFVFVSFNSESFKRTVSNLTNNAVESISDTGRVSIYLRKQLNSVILEIKDSGPGIPDDILKNIQENKKITSGKGLGLPHAIKSIAEWGADFKINTTGNTGTSFQIIFPIQTTPDWIQEQIYVHDRLNIIVIDDDYSVFKTWEEIIKKQFKNIKVTYLDNPEKLDIDVSVLENKLFLIDYHFYNSKITGFDLIKNFSLNKAILVTNKYPDASLKSKLRENHIQYIFKQSIFLIKLIELHENSDLILIDDNKLIRDTWMIESQKYGKRMIAFSNKHSFIKCSGQINLSTPIYLDLNLQNENGNEIAGELYKLGYKKLYITTGYCKEKINESPWIVDVIDKIPPFSKLK